MFHGTTESFDEANLARSVNGNALLKTAQHMLQGDHPEFVFYTGDTGTKVREFKRFSISLVAALNEHDRVYPREGNGPGVTVFQPFTTAESLTFRYDGRPRYALRCVPSRKLHWVLLALTSGAARALVESFEDADGAAALAALAADASTLSPGVSSIASVDERIARFRFVGKADPAAQLRDLNDLLSAKLDHYQVSKVTDAGKRQRATESNDARFNACRGGVFDAFQKVCRLSGATWTDADFASNMSLWWWHNIHLDQRDGSFSRVQRPTLAAHSGAVGVSAAVRGPRRSSHSGDSHPSTSSRPFRETPLSAQVSRTGVPVPDNPLFRVPCPLCHDLCTEPAIIPGMMHRLSQCHRLPEARALLRSRDCPRSAAGVCDVQSTAFEEQFSSDEGLVSLVEGVPVASSSRVVDFPAPSDGGSAVFPVAGSVVPSLLPSASSVPAAVLPGRRLSQVQLDYETAAVSSFRAGAAQFDVVPVSVAVRASSASSAFSPWRFFLASIVLVVLFLRFPVFDVSSRDSVSRCAFPPTLLSRCVAQSFTSCGTCASQPVDFLTYALDGLPSGAGVCAGRDSGSDECVVPFPEGDVTSLVGRLVAREDVPHLCPARAGVGMRSGVGRFTQDAGDDLWQPVGYHDDVAAVRAVFPDGTGVVLRRRLLLMEQDDPGAMRLPAVAQVEAAVASAESPVWRLLGSCLSGVLVVFDAPQATARWGELGFHTCVVAQEGDVRACLDPLFTFVRACLGVESRRYGLVVVSDYVSGSDCAFRLVCTRRLVCLPPVVSHLRCLSMARRRPRRRRRELMPARRTPILPLTAVSISRHADSCLCPDVASWDEALAACFGDFGRLVVFDVVVCCVVSRPVPEFLCFCPFHESEEGDSLSREHNHMEWSFATDTP